jgi:uncharacterized protein (DUF1778 family)
MSRFFFGDIDMAKAHKKIEAIRFRVSPREKREIYAAAKVVNRSVSGYLRALHREAERER